MIGSICIGKRLLHTTLLSCIVIFSFSFSTTALAKRSPQEVFKWQKTMAQAGYASALYKLAVMYQNGYGTSRDLKKALALYKQAAAKGYKKATPRISEVEIMIDSGDFDAPQKNSEQEALNREKAKLEADKKRFRKEQEALNRSKKAAKEAQFRAQRQKEQSANSQKHVEQQRLNEERQKLNQEMAQLHKEKARLAKEKQALEAEKERAAADEMDKLEQQTIMLMSE
ncbi:MAG: hypothetical protein OEL79_07955 [Chromatiales bacterium]|nr:hypothetical protein [Chromatiales bacterium]